MIQLTISVKESNMAWFTEFKAAVTKQNIQQYAVYINSEINGVIYSSIGGEDKHRQKIYEIVTNALIKVYLTVVKSEYVASRLTLTSASQLSQVLIQNTLVAFDRENEQKILRRDIDIDDYFSLDGFYNFRMSELKSRWGDVCKLATDNAKFLSNESTVNDLLKFLLTAIDPKVNTSEISECAGTFIVKEHTVHGAEQRVFATYEQLMLHLIDTAPIKIIIRGHLNDSFVRDKIKSIFDSAENIL